MVEEARLESVYTGNRIEGSNPSVSAKIFTLTFAVIISTINSLFTELMQSLTIKEMKFAG